MITISVNLQDRRESKVEFDNNYFKIHDDAINLIKNNFGAKKDIADNYKYYIGVMANKILNDVMDLGTYIRIANSIYPRCMSEYEERRTYQSKAIGLCFDLLTKYQLTMHQLKVKDDKFVEEAKHVTHEINCLKKWRESDVKRFKNLG